MQTLLLLLLIRTFISCFLWPPSADESRGEEEEGAVKKRKLQSAAKCSLANGQHSFSFLFCVQVMMNRLNTVAVP